jgi:hypothetical protein
MIEIVLGILLGTIAITFINVALYLRTKRLGAQRLYRDRFYDVAERIYSNEGLTDEMLERLRRLAEDFDNPLAFDSLWKAIKMIESEIRNGKSYSGKYLPDDESLRKEWATMLHSYLLALSYSRLLWGYLARDALARMFDPRDIEENTEMIDWRLHSGLKTA